MGLTLPVDDCQKVSVAVGRRADHIFFNVSFGFSLDITVHELYLELKPKDYVDQATFIKSFDEKLAKKSNWHRRASRRNSTTMDTSEVKSEVGTVPTLSKS